MWSTTFTLPAEVQWPVRRSQMAKTEADIIEYIGQDEEPYDRAIQRYDHKRRRELMAQLLQGAKRGRVLDLGCSNGSWYEFLRDQDFAEIHGVELSERRAQLAAAKGYQVYIGRGQDTPYEDGYFDVIINQDVLVHVLEEADRKAMIVEAKRILKTGGTYVLTVPSAKAEGRRRIINCYSGYDALVWLKHRLVGRQGRVERLPAEEFNRYWPVDDLLEFLASIDLRVVDMVGHTFYFGDLSSNFPALQGVIDRFCARRWPQTSSIVFVKTIK